MSITRDEQDARGPLEGLRAGMESCLLPQMRRRITSCDVPLLVPAFVQRLIELLGEHDIAVMEIDGFTHPLSAVYRRTTRLPLIEDLLAHDRLRPAFLFDAVRTRRVRTEGCGLPIPSSIRCGISTRGLPGGACRAGLS